MTLPVHLFDSPQAAGAAMAQRIITLLAQTPAGQPFLLGCPGGRTARPVYGALAACAIAQDLDLSRLIIVMMDEYLDGTPPTLTMPDPAAHYSCRGFAEREIRAILNAQRPPERQIPPDAIWLPDPADPAAYDRRIAGAGGIGYFILASGAGDGHVAFNPPGSPRDSCTRIVALAEQTRRDNLATFPAFTGLSQVPAHGVTVGIGTIARHSAEAGMLLWGKGKRTAFARISASNGYDPDWPASVIALCPGAAIYADHEAAR